MLAGILSLHVIVVVVHEFLHRLSDMTVGVVVVCVLASLFLRPPFAAMTRMNEFILLNVVIVELVHVCLDELTWHFTAVISLRAATSCEAKRL